MLKPKDSDRFNRLLTSLAEVFAGEKRSGGDEAATALCAARHRRYRRVGATATPASPLDAACALPNALPLAGQVHACRNLIDWTSWEGEGLAPEISANLYSAELVGPDGHVEASGVRVGLLLSDVRTDYPVSRHSGEETYVVIAGVAEWTVADMPYTARLPGSLIHHPAWVPHGRRTGAEPFLGAWRWSGDLDLSSFRVDR